jgi:mannan endo-1,4-beta-mannosidase
MVDDVLEAADVQGFRVMRIWGSLDVGDLNDGSTSVGGGPKESVYLQYWDPAAGRPAYKTARTASSGSTTRSPRPASWASGS